MWILVACVFALVVYLKVIKPLSYWKIRNVTYVKPWSMVRSLVSFIFRTKSFTDLLKELYNDYPGKRYVGTFAFTEPQLLLRDPELIKQITIKDFDFFVNRAKKTDEVDPLLSKNLLALHGQEWRDMRATLSPSFTSSKMRFMFELLSKCAQQLTDHYQDAGVIDVEMKDVGSRFTNDAIATSAFGIEVNSFKNKDNEFFTRGKDAISFGGTRALVVLGYTLFPTLMRWLKIPIFPLSLSTFFKRIVKETIDMREKNNLVRPDMIHLLVEARKGREFQEDHVQDAEFAIVEEHASDGTALKKPLTDEDITAQALIFFFGGFDTSSTLISFLGHEIAVNSEVQERLREEVDDTYEKCGGKITYEALMKMKYLDMVVSETLRKWPPSIVLARMCERDYVIEAKTQEEVPVTVTKEMSVLIPVYALHHDPQLFPEPDKFDPERFSDENKSQIVPGSYLPFGIGPRSCIASRFALLETKVLFFHLLLKFKLVTTKKTPIPLVIGTKDLSLGPDGGFWIGLQSRENKKVL